MEYDEINADLSEKYDFDVKLEDLPKIISDQIDKISDLENHINASEEKANMAMKIASEMVTYTEKGKGIFKHKSGDTKDIVLDTQKAVKQLADAQQVSVTALQKSLDFQKQLSTVSKYLFGLGVLNLAANRVSVRTIQMKLENASKEEISELARQELINVIKQLKDQEDILNKHEALSLKVKENRDFIEGIHNKLDTKDIIDSEQTEKIENLTTALSEKEELDRAQDEKISNLNSALSEKDKIDNEQDERISSLSSALSEKDKIDNEQDERISSLSSALSEKDKIDNEQSKKLDELKALLDSKDSIDKKQEESIKIIFDYMKNKDKLDEKQNKDIKEAIIGTKNSKKITIIFSSIAIVLSIINTIIIFLK